MLTDLSEIRKKEKELETLHETKDRLFAIIGHDLRKPALAFRGISKKVNYLIKQNQLERLYKFGGHIEKMAFAMNNLLDNVLNWALQQRAMLPYNPVIVNIKENIDDSFQLFRQIADDKGVTLTLDIDENYTIFFDSNAFNTIIRNLLDNAIKYTPLGGTVSLSADRQEGGILLKIADTGIGMEQDTINDIFLLKKNKSIVGTNGEEGNGLGLILVRDLIALNKGTIKVISRWNGGTTFEIFLPAG